MHFVLNINLYFLSHFLYVYDDRYSFVKLLNEVHLFLLKILLFLIMNHNLKLQYEIEHSVNP